MQSILSVGIDVGTSTTQVVFSRLEMDNSAGYFTVPRVSIVDKKVIYKSKIYLTPLKTDVLIDADALRVIVADEFKNAGFKPEDTNSGAVIITGESARKENSDAVLESLSGFAGDFVVSAAGPDMESLIAGKGSGAYQYSLDHHATVANLDIGGGTTNVVIFDDGQAIARGCLDIGGRLIMVGYGGKIKKVSPAAACVAKSVGVDIQVGQQVNVPDLEKITDKMAQILDSYLGFEPRGELETMIKTPGSSDFPNIERLDAIFFSGGVADMIYNPEEDIRKYGDIGVLLGNSIRKSRMFALSGKVKPGETIRATVVGAGTYTTSISGSTIAYSDDIFPLKNIPVVKLDEKLQDALFSGIKTQIIEKIRWFMQQNDVSQFVLAMPGKKDPGYMEMKTAATTIREIMDEVLLPGSPILLVIESDIAKAMGQMLKLQPQLNRQVVAIDSIMVSDGEFVDMGKPMMNGMVIPVVVKTLIFG